MDRAERDEWGPEGVPGRVVGGGDRVGHTAGAGLGDGAAGAGAGAGIRDGDGIRTKARNGDRDGVGVGDRVGIRDGHGDEIRVEAEIGGGGGLGNEVEAAIGDGGGDGAGGGPGNEVGAVGKPLVSVVGRGRPVVLVLRALGLGDLLTAVPAFKALRRRLPGHEIVLAAPERLAPVAAATGLVDRLLPTRAAGREVPADLVWTGPPPGLAVDLHGNGPPSHLLLQRLGPRRLLAYAHPGTPDIRGPVWREDEHERKRWCRLLGWYGFDADPDDLGIPAPTAASPAPGAIVMHPGADAGARRWPAKRFAAVAGELRRRGHEVVVTAGAGEEARARYVAAAAGLPPSAVLVGADGDLPFDRLAALVAGARCVIVGDTGPAHLATALGTPSVVLFGPVAPRLWGPPSTPRHRALWHPCGNPSPRPGDAHDDLPDERLLRITADEVVTATLDVLNVERGSPSQTARQGSWAAGQAPPDGLAGGTNDRRAEPGCQVAEDGRASGPGGAMTREVLR